jgi:hypothetical protein
MGHGRWCFAKIDIRQLASENRLAISRAKTDHGTSIRGDLMRFVIATMLLVGFLMPARAMDANQLLGVCSKDNGLQKMGCAGYLRGVFDGILLVQSDPSSIKIFCAPENATTPQIKDIVMKMLHDYPEARTLHASQFIANALHDAWPCPNWFWQVIRSSMMVPPFIHRGIHDGIGSWRVEITGRKGTWRTQIKKGGDRRSNRGFEHPARAHLAGGDIHTDLGEAP